ncbi:MAG: hypothetical protein WBF17_11935 [Phycisphaerae bacterium]
MADESIAMEEGRLDAARRVPLRRLNGDEYYRGVIIGPEPGVRKFSLYGYD